MTRERRLDIEEIRALIQLAAESEIIELDVDVPNLKVRIKKPARGGGETPAGSLLRANGERAEPRGERDPQLVPIVAPMVGTFYRAAKPEAPPFVNEGDDVRIGQTVCVLEAMKLFNEITSEVAGRIARVLVENASPVEYGQPLFLVEPA